MNEWINNIIQVKICSILTLFVYSSSCETFSSTDSVSDAESVSDDDVDTSAAFTAAASASASASAITLFEQSVS